jgi:hypothetical protein
MVRVGAQVMGAHGQGGGTGDAHARALLIRVLPSHPNDTCAPIAVMGNTLSWDVSSSTSFSTYRGISPAETVPFAPK